MKTIGIVQARMTSTRLPGKILMEVLGKPLLEYEIERLRKVPSLDGLVIATTTNRTDDPVIDLCESLGVLTYRGSEHDVLSRYCEAATRHAADAVVRFTADCPVIDPDTAERVIKSFLENAKDVDYCSNDVPNTYPRGTDTEVFSMKALSDAHREAKSQAEREHVTPFIYNRPERYRITRLKGSKAWAKYRLTVDTPEDFELVKKIIETLYPTTPNFALRDIIALLDENPEMQKINAAVKQKRP